jgi:hypothetical protein
MRAVSIRWAALASGVVFVFAVVAVGVALVQGNAGIALGAIGVAVPLVIGIWTVEYLRRDFLLTHRPYLAILGTTQHQSVDGIVHLELLLTNAGDVPGRIVEEACTHTVGGEAHQLKAGKTITNIVYRGEVVKLHYDTALDAQLDYELTYQDLECRRSFHFRIKYLVTGPTEAAIVEKDAS